MISLDIGPHPFWNYHYLLIIVFFRDRPMRCYQCNSAEDTNCNSSDAKELRQYIKLCPLLKGGTYAGSEPIACRKIVQSVEDVPTHIIRECAYTGDKQLDGMRKQGNKAIRMLYYQCENMEGYTLSINKKLSVTYVDLYHSESIAYSKTPICAGNEHFCCLQLTFVFRGYSMVSVEKKLSELDYGEFYQSFQSCNIIS
uniref:Protein quiver n=1 Tax=Elaeophora elaphi TaxID=1147741 RepID=A0A0R3RQR1_9BILA